MYTEIYNRFNCKENRITMSREAIADVGIALAKKRYILHVLDNEGVVYSKPKLKIMGLEAVKSSTPAAVRTMLKDIIITILTKSEAETQTEIANYRKQFNELPPEAVSSPRGVSDIDKWVDGSGYKKGTPIHVRGAINYNQLVYRLNLKGKYEPIANGNKIKFAYMKTPNPLRENVIAFPDKLPIEFGLHRYIDYELQFEKTFLSSIEMILAAVNWSSQESTSIDLFGD
jgi:DNA polymerase elongation subunit (family B)